MTRFAFAAATLLLACAAHPASAADLSLTSPDGRTAISVSADDGQILYSVTYRHRQIIAPSGLGLQFEGYKRLGPGMAIAATSRRSGEDSYKLSPGKVSSVRDRYNELKVDLAETGGEKRRLEILFRAYDGGVAFRYRIPAQPNLRDLRLANENSQFVFPADYDCHALNLGKFGTSHEGEFDAVKASSFRPHNLLDLPVVCRTGEGDTSFAIAEADLRNYAGLYLTGMETGSLGLEAKLSSRVDDPQVAVITRLSGDGLTTPWRVIMIGDQPGRLIESTLITSLNPPASGDFSWVKPGKTAWDWWNGPSVASVAQPGMNNETIRAFIDFASESGFPYMLIDDGWYVNSGAGGALLPGADNMRSIPQIDLPGLVRYAGERNVGIWVWVHWKLLNQNMDRALPYYAKLGIKGIKVDFMDRDDQQMVDFYHRLIGTAADNRLMVDLHGAYHPTGLIRTWPNFVTQEGVMGAEYNKWSRRVTPRHNVTLPFTRGLLGPYDYTPGGFGNSTPSAFKVQSTLPMVQTSRGQALAMYVVYDSPFQGVSDSPDRYRNQPGFDFLKAVPTSWDETRVIAGRIGEYVVVARRSGRTWYVGAMTNEQPRIVQVPLDFLSAGAEATIWQDGSEATAIQKSSRSVTARDSIALSLAPAGGAAIMLVPAPEK